jgi:hypothetical protein
MVERNMCNAVMRGIVVPPPHHAQKDRVGTWDISGLTAGSAYLS